MKELAIILALFGLARGQFVCPRADGTDICIDGDFPNPVDCRTFYKCSACIAYLSLCPANLHFSGSLRLCVYPWEANCIASTIRPSSSSTTTPTTTTTTTTARPSTSGSTSPSSASPSTTSTTRTTTTTRPSTSTTTARTDGGLGTLAVAMSFEVEGVLDPVNFNSVFTNVGTRYVGGYYTVPESGVYFFHTSVAARATKGVTFALSGSPYTSNVLRTSTAHNGADTMSRDFLASLNRNARLKQASTNPNGVYSDGELQTSWSGFSLSAAMRNLVAFCATRTAPWSTVGKVLFPDVILNAGNAWQTTNHVFRAPVSGTYYLSYSAGVRAFAGVRAQLVSDVRGTIVEMWRDSTNHNGYDQMSRATLVSLSGGEEVRVVLEGGEMASSAESRATSFCGFLYDPKSPPVAWSVHRTTSWVSAGSRLDPVEFQDVLVNEGGAWNPTTSYITIPRRGYYFVHANVGAMEGRQVNFNMVYNNVRSAADVLRASDMHNGVDTLGRGIIGDFDAGDQIRITSSPGTAVYSDTDRQTSFSGFLLFEY